jgi:serine/threonine protein kinase
VDFGCSEFMQGHGATTSHSNGTLSYFAPEMFTQSLFAGPPLDVWALGVILFAMLCGYLPFDGSPDLSYKDRLPDSQVRRNICLCEYDPAETLSNGAIVSTCKQLSSLRANY